MKKSVPLATMFWFAGLSMLGFLATDMYLPAFESIRTEMQTSESMIGLSLTIFLLGMAIGQLIYGPLSDAVGRIQVLLFGMILFCFATIGCFFANSIEALLFARFVQALGACSASVIWQAIVIDRYDSKNSQRIFATIMPLVAISPAIAPLLGAAIEAYFGWRSIFIALLLLGIILIASSRGQAESAPKTQSRGSFCSTLLQDYKEIFASQKFIGNMLIFSGCSAAFFAWLTGSPFVMTNMSYSSADIAMSFVPQTIAFITGGYACRHFIDKIKGPTLLFSFVLLFIVSVSVIFILSTQVQMTSILPTLLVFCFLAMANGALYPLVVNKALEGFKHCSATAAGLLNFIQTMICFLASGTVSAFLSYGLVTISSVMFASGGSVALGYILSKKANQEPV